MYSGEFGVNMRLNNDSILSEKSGLISCARVLVCVIETAACEAMESLKVSWSMADT